VSLYWKAIIRNLDPDDKKSTSIDKYISRFKFYKMTSGKNSGQIKLRKTPKCTFEAGSFVVILGYKPQWDEPYKNKLLGTDQDTYGNLEGMF
jgi:hypothetical protein